MKIFSIAIIALILAAFAGCSKDSIVTDGSATTDVQAIQSIVTNTDSIAEFSSSDEELLDDQSDMEWSSALKTTTPIKAFKWRRQVVHVDHSVSVAITGDTLAVATLSKVVTGNLIIKGSYSLNATHFDTTITKPFSEQSKRKIMFVRVARTERPSHNWRPVSLTLVTGASQPDSLNKFTIAQVELFSPSDTFTVTSALDTWLRFNNLRGCVPHVRNNDSMIVRLTVYSSDDSSEGVALRWSGEFNRNRERMRLVSETNSAPVSGYTYTRVYQRGMRAHVPLARIVGRFNVVVDVFSNGTLNDNSASVSNSFWGFPYDVRRR